MEPFSPSPLPEELRGSKVILKRQDFSAAREVFRSVDQDRARLGRFLPWVDATLSIEDSKMYIDWARRQWDEARVFDYGIYLPDERYLGNAGAHGISWPHHSCEIGYWILGEFEGQGFISDTVKCLEAALFAHGFHRIEIRCDPTNLRSKAVPERLGYHQEAHFRRHQLIQGRWRDTLVFAKLKSS